MAPTVAILKSVLNFVFWIKKDHWLEIWKEVWGLLVDKKKIAGIILIGNPRWLPYHFEHFHPNQMGNWLELHWKYLGDL